MKQHDFLATLVKNPDLTIDDLRENGITPDNSDFLSKEVYKSNPNVIEAFKDDSGKFDEKKFDTYYDNARILYANYASDELVQNINKNFTYGPDAWFAPEDAVYRNDNPIIYLNKQPRSTAQGISYITEEFDAGNDLSIRELGQREKVYDYETGEFLDWSPNDKAGLFKPIGLPTLVLAQWDTDGTHIENGVEVSHKAGDIKLNANGRPYYETLGNRDIYSKDVLRNSDILTVDGSKWNKFDFFDSDDIKKSIGKTVASVVAKVAPMFIPVVGEIYGYFGAADGLIRVAPVLLKSINSILTGSNDNMSGRALNKWEAYVSRYDQTSSDWGREHLASIESVGNLVTDISRQLFEQKAVSTIPVLLKKARGAKSVEAALENSKNLAENSKRLALAYMAATSAQDTYSTFKKAGATDAVAGLGMLASSLALYRLMNIDYFRDNILKNTFMDESEVRAALKGVAKSAADKLVPQVEAGTTKQAASFVKKASDFYHDTMLKSIQGKGFAGLVARGFSEGTEEVMEEVTTDLIKGVTEGLNALGIPVTNQNQDLDFGWSAQDFATRYGTSFAGGFLGGMIFAGQHRYEQWLNRKKYNLDKIDPTDLQRLTYYIATGKRGEIDDYLNRWYNKGVLGSKNVSIDGDVMTSLDGKSEFIPSTEGMSQNEAVYRAVKYTLDTLQEAIETEIPDLRLLTGEGYAQLRSLGYSDDELRNNPRLITASSIAALGDYDSFQNDLFETLSQIAVVKSKLNDKVDELAKKETPDTEEARKAQAQSIKDNPEIKRLQEELKHLREEKDKFFSGAKNKYYAGQAIFAANKGLNQYFVNLTKEEFTKLNTGLSYESLNEEEKKNIDDLYDKEYNKEGRENIYRAYDLFLALDARASEILTKHGEKLDKAFKERHPVTLALSKYAQFGENHKKLSSEYAELENISEDERTEDQSKRMIELQIQLQTLEDERRYLEKNPIISMITSDPVASQFFTTIGSDQKVKLYHDSIDKSERSSTAVQILNILREVYRNDVSSGNYRFDDAELQALLQSIASSYITEGGAAAAFSAYQTMLEDDVLSNFDDIDNPVFLRDPEFATSLVRIVNSFVKNLGVDNIAAMSNYNELFELLRSKTRLLEPGNEEYLKDFLSQMLPTIGGEHMVDIITEFDNYRQNINYSAFLDIAKSIGTDVRDLNLLSLVEQQTRYLTTQSELTDYIIKNEAIANSLSGDSFRKMIGAITAVIHAAYDGTNDIMNNFKDRSEKKNDNSIPQLAVISDKAGQELWNQGQELLNRINFLVELSNANKKRSLITHKNTAIAMRPKWIKALLALKDSILKEFGFEEDWWNNITANLSIEVASDNYNAFEKAVIEFENALYDKFNEVYNSRTDQNQLKELASKLVNIVNSKTLFKAKTTKITDDPKEGISELDLVYYLASIVSLKSQDFYETIMTVNDPKIAPVYGQEFVTKQLVSQIVNPGLFNAILDQIQDQDNADYTGLSEEEINWYKGKSVLYNLGVVLGSAGSGKTVAVIKKILSVLTNNANIDVKFIAKSEKQAENALNNSGITGIAMSSNDYLTKINGGIVTGYKLKDDGHFTADEPPLDRVSKVFDDSAQIKITVIDEIETLTEVELYRIATDAKRNNIFILGLGDLKQPGTDIQKDPNNANKGYRSSSIEDTFFVGTPVLTTSMRAQTAAQVDNTNLLSKGLEEALKENDIDSRASKISGYISNAELLYYEDPNSGEVSGIMPVDSQDQIDVKIAKLKELPGKILIITEDGNTGKYDKYTSDKVDIVKYSDRAGVEADYVIVDVDLKAHNSRDHGLNSFLLAQDIYTLTQRSRKGTVIKIDTRDIPFKFKSDKNSAVSVKIDESAIREFTKWRNEALSFIAPNVESIKEAILDSPLVKGYNVTTPTTSTPPVKNTTTIGGSTSTSTTTTSTSSTPTTPSTPAPVVEPSAEEPSVPGSYTSVAPEPPTPNPGEAIPEIAPEPIPEPESMKINLKEALLGLSDYKITTSKEFVKALSEIFPYAKVDILKTLSNAKGNIDDLLNNPAIIRELENAVRLKYGGQGLQTLDLLLHNPEGFPEEEALKQKDFIDALRPVYAGISNNGQVSVFGFRKGITSSLGEFNEFILGDEFEAWSKENRTGVLNYKDIRSVLNPAYRNTFPFKVLRDRLVKLGSYVRTGYFNKITDVIKDIAIREDFIKFADGNVEMWIVPYKDKGLLVSRHYTKEGDDYFDIPLLLVNTDKFGKYNNNLFLKTPCRLHNSEDRETLEEIKAKGVYLSSKAGVVKNPERVPDDVDDRTIIYLDENDGKPMLAYTDEIALKEKLLDSGPRGVYMTDIQNLKSVLSYERLALMGIQCRCSFSELVSLIEKYRNYAKLEGDRLTPRIINSETKGVVERVNSVQSEVLDKAELLRDTKGNIKQILPSDRCGQLLALACLYSNNPRTKLNALLNYLDNPTSNYKTTYTLELETKVGRRKVHYTIANVNGNYVVGDYNKGQKAFIPNDQVNLSFPVNDPQWLSKMIKGLFGENVLPSLHFHYYSLNKNNGKLYDSPVSTNWELSELIADMGQSDLNKFEELLSRTKLFRYGVYLDDSTIKETAPDGSYYGILDMTGRVYDTDRTIVSNSEYLIDEDSIIPVDENVPVKQSLSSFIEQKHLGIKADNVEEANRLLMEKGSDWDYMTIVETDTEYRLQKVDTRNDSELFSNLILAKYKINLTNEEAENILMLSPESEDIRFFIDSNIIVYVDDNGKLYLNKSNMWVDDVIIKAKYVWDNSGIFEYVSGYLANKFFGLSYDENAFMEAISENDELATAVSELEEIWPCNI